MSTVTVHIQDQHTPHYAGQHIHGHVEIELFKETKCRKITLEMGWYTHGWGNETNTTITEMNIHDGGVLPAGTHTFPFDFILPEGTYTYHGINMNLDWYVECNVDIPWGRDYNASEDFLVVPSPKPEHQVAEHAPEKAQKNNGLAMIGGGVLATILTLLIFAYSFYNEEWEDTICCMAICVGIAGWALYTGIHRFLATRLVTQARMTHRPEFVHAGEVFEYDFTFTPGINNTDVTSITLSLTCVETTTRGSGSDAETRAVPLVELQEVFPNIQDLPKGQPVTYTARFQIPEDAPYSFGIPIGSHHLTWTLKADMDIPFWPDWSDTEVVECRPNYAKLDASSPSVHNQGDAW